MVDGDGMVDESGMVDGDGIVDESGMVDGVEWWMGKDGGWGRMVDGVGW